LIEGVSLPTDEWVKAMQNLNEKTARLHKEYEADCVKQKVSARSYRPIAGFLTS